jgi:toxin CcdB
MVGAVQFDVCRVFEPGRSGSEGRLAVVLQHDMLADLSTRVVAPLIAEDDAGSATARMVPIVNVLGTRYAIAIQLCGTVPVRALGEPIANLEAEQAAIKNTIDRLFLGF